jgi:hypothetical protein
MNKIVNGEIIAMTQEEIDDFMKTLQAHNPTLEERLAVVEDDTEAIAIVLADIVGVEV